MPIKINIRPIRHNEISLLKEFLYLAIFQPDKSTSIPRSEIEKPEISNYIDNFGTKKDDHCLVAELNGEVIAAVWVRLLDGKIKGFGYIDSKTPEFAISVVEKYRSQGIGKRIMHEMIQLLKKKGYEQLSLAVQKENYAVKLYSKLGFRSIRETEEEYIMRLNLS